MQSDLGGEALAGFYSLIMTCELHGINPQDYLADILVRLANGHPKSDIDSLLPWNWKDDLSRLKVSATDEYIEQDYPIDQLIIKLDFKGKVYFDDICQAPPQITGVSELAALSP